MRKNVWKRFLAATLAAVVMFTSVDCTGLVVNAEGTTKTLAEIVVAHNSEILTDAEKAILGNSNLVYNKDAYNYDFGIEPESDVEVGLKKAVDLDIATKSITVRSYTDDQQNILWEPTEITVNFADSSEESETAIYDSENGVYRYEKSAEVVNVDVAFVASAIVEHETHAEVLNAVKYFVDGSDAVVSLLDDLKEYTPAIEESSRELATTLDYYKTFSSKEEYVTFLNLKGISLPEIDVDSIANYAAGLQGFNLGTIYGSYDKRNTDKLKYWIDNAEAVAAIISNEEMTETIAALVDNEDLKELGDFLCEAGEALSVEQAVNRGNAIYDYMDAYDEYSWYMEEEGISVSDLLLDKIELIKGYESGISLPKKKDTTFYEADDVGERVIANLATGTVSVDATDRTITVNVSAFVIEGNNEKPFGPAAVDVVIEKGKNLEDLKAEAAEKVEKILAGWDKDDAYDLNDYSDVYNPTYYDCDIEAGDIAVNGITENASISIKYFPKDYIVTYKEAGKEDETVTVPYLHEITLPKSEVEEQSYEYKLVKAPEMDNKVRDEGAKYVIKGDVTFERKLGKKKDSYKVNDIVLMAYPKFKDTDAEEILTSEAVVSDEIAVRKPDNTLISATVEGKNTIVKVPSYVANENLGLTWVPNKVIVKNKGNVIPQATVEAKDIVDGVAVVTYPKRDSIEVEYVLEVASGEKANEYVNLPYDLVTSVQSHLLDMADLVKCKEDMASLKGGLLGTLSNSPAIENYTDVKEALANIANAGCTGIGSGDLLVTYYIEGYLKCNTDVERVQYYYNNFYKSENGKYSGIRPQIELLAENLAVIVAPENKPALDALIELADIPGAAEKVGMLTTYAGIIGELAESHFKPMHKSIIPENGKYNELLNILVNSDVGVDKVENVTSLCMTETLSIGGTDLPAAAKEQTVTVKVEWTQNGNVSSEAGTVVFYDVDATEDVEALIDAEANRLAENLVVDKLHYGCVEPAIVVNPENGSTVVYKWSAKNYTVEFIDENGESVGTAQTFTYENPVFQLERPDEHHEYTYVIDAKEKLVVFGEETEKYTLTDNEFKTLFDDKERTSVQITRKVSDVEFDDAYITIKLVKKGSDGIGTEVGSYAYKFKVSGLGDGGVDDVKARAAQMAEEKIDTEHYKCTGEPTNNDLYAEITGDTTVTYTWEPKEYYVELWEEGDANYYSRRPLYYDNLVITLDKPSETQVHTFDINGPVTVKFEDSGEYTLTPEVFKVLFDDANTDTIKIYKTVSDRIYNVTVEVNWKNKSDSRTFAYDANVNISELAARLSEDLGVDTKHYTCVEPPALDGNPGKDVILVYKWNAKKYTVELPQEDDESSYKTQEVTIEEPVFYLTYPTSEKLVYKYEVLGQEYTLPYTEGETVFDIYLEGTVFDAFFAQGDKVSISREEKEKEVKLYVRVEVLDGTGENVIEDKKNELSVPMSALAGEAKALVKNEAALLASALKVDEKHYKYVEPELGETLKEGETITFKWIPNEYTLKIVDENGQLCETTKFYYDERTRVAFKRPESSKIKYYYDLGGPAPKEVLFKSGETTDSIDLRYYFEGLFVKEATEAVIVRTAINIEVEEKQDNVATLKDNLGIIYGPVGVKDNLNVIQYNQQKEDDTEGKNGNPEALLIRIEDNESEDGGIAKSVAATVGALAIYYPHVKFVPLDEKGNPVKDKNGDVVERYIVKDNEISLQAAIDAFLHTGIGTARIDAMYEKSNGSAITSLPKDVVSTEAVPAKYRLFARNSSEKLGAEIFAFDVEVGEYAPTGELEKTELQFIFSFLDEKVTPDNKTVRDGIKKLRTVAEVTGKGGNLTVDLNKGISKEVFETYLMMMLLEGETDLSRIGEVELTNIVEYEHKRFVTDLDGKTITSETLENTIAKSGYKYVFSENPTLEKVVNKLLDAYMNDGYKNSTTSAIKFYMDDNANKGAEADSTFFRTEAKTESILDVLSTKGFDKKLMENLTAGIKQEEMNGYLDIPVKVTAAGVGEDYAALIISAPENLEEIAAEELAKTAANTIELVDANYLLNNKVPGNSMVVMLSNELENSVIEFKGNGILDLNGHIVKEVVGENQKSTVVLVDSTYNNGGSGKAGDNVKDARQSGKFYTVQKDGNNLIVKLNGKALENAAEVGTHDLKLLAIDIAVDLMINNISSGDMKIDTYEIYDMDFVDDIFEVVDSFKKDKLGLANDVVDLVTLGAEVDDAETEEKEGFFGFINDVLATLTKVNSDTNALEVIEKAATKENDPTIKTYKVVTNPIKVNLDVAGSGAGYLTAGINTVKSEASKTFDITIAMDQDSVTDELKSLIKELKVVVEKSDANVDLENITVEKNKVVLDGAVANATLHVNLTETSEKEYTNDYAAVIAMIAACGNDSSLSNDLKVAVEDYLETKGSIDKLKPAVESITVKQLISAVKAANGKTFAEIAAAMQLEGNPEDVKTLATAYDDLFLVVYRMATIISDRLGIEGNNKTLGGLFLKEETAENDAYTYYVYGAKYEKDPRTIDKMLASIGFGAKAEGSVYADLSIKLFVEGDEDSNKDPIIPENPSKPNGGSGSGSSSEDKKPVEVHPAPTNPATPSSTTGTATGDTNNMALWISVMGVAIIAVVSVVVMKKKRTK